MEYFTIFASLKYSGITHVNYRIAFNKIVHNIKYIAGWSPVRTGVVRWVVKSLFCVMYQKFDSSLNR